MAQLNRLSSVFGKDSFRGERLELLWGEVKGYGSLWFQRVIDGKIRTLRHAPLPQDFAEDIAQERERQWSAEKRDNATTAHEFWNGTYADEDVQMISQTIAQRMRKQISDEDWEKFVKMLEQTSSSAGRQK